ncbi:hypothetical protein M0R89_19335 (plasmid) [Halorussus limi]|uniref:Uncharacterized protein n=1 Tax=Halorussus limi TaxID=2938695 RepID=A0A8U0HZE9_9EURY|nr:hypothetical protein [Halorussus limi]UPV76318.1 hypothetical protein M0R89_19335 [Halorussus limi]
MSSGITDDDKERIASFCETPSHARSPDDLTPDQSDDRRDDDGDESLFRAVWHRIQGR